MTYDETVILGAGESGTGAAILAKKQGLNPFVSDFLEIKNKYKTLLDGYGISYEEKQHSENRILKACEIIKSPGIHPKSPIIQKIKAKGIPIISEIELAGRYTKARTICITGSNGKTTTTSLIYHILNASGLNVAIVGNIGNSLALQIAEKEADYYVIELSSFQLDGMYRFRADIAVLLNITPDHLDHYGYEIRNYVHSKMRILQNQTEEQAFIYWEEDPLIVEELQKIHSPVRLYPFAEKKKIKTMAYTGNKQLIIEDFHRPFSVILNKFPLQGKHNLYNSLAAAMVAKLLRVDNDILQQAIADFKSVEHRMEKIARINDVDYINDSKATNVNACFYALQSVNTPTILILGGIDKGNDYSEIEALVVEKCKALIFLGIDNSALYHFFNGKIDEIYEVYSMKKAVEQAYKIAQKGDTVLLSPCCASFDLFQNYEDRGRQFKQFVFLLS